MISLSFTSLSRTVFFLTQLISVALWCVPGTKELISAGVVIYYSWETLDVLVH